MFFRTTSEQPLCLLCQQLLEQEPDSKSRNLLKNKLINLVKEKKYSFDQKQDYNNFYNAVRQNDLDSVNFFLFIGNDPFKNDYKFYDCLDHGEAPLKTLFNDLKTKPDIYKAMIDLLEPFFDGKKPKYAEMSYLKFK